jgi:hypothetical protein
VLLDYRYTYDSASNIVRVDDDRAPCWITTENGLVPADTCPSPGTEGRIEREHAF